MWWTYGQGWGDDAAETVPVLCGLLSDGFYLVYMDPYFGIIAVSPVEYQLGEDKVVCFSISL